MKRGSDAFTLGNVRLGTFEQFLDSICVGQLWKWEKQFKFSLLALKLGIFLEELT